MKRTHLLLALLLVPLGIGCGTNRSGGSGSGEDDDAADDDDTVAGSAGCGRAPTHAAGGVQVPLDAGPAGDGQRGFWLTLPPGYDTETPSALIVAYPGTSQYGEWMVPYLNLEADQRSDEILVYPDPLWRDFEGWGNLGGWLLGPNAYPADGDQDLVFTSALLDYLEESYCIDPDRIFATGHSWGGDMTQVVSCLMGDRFTAAVSTAANRPYWFEEPGGGWTECIGDIAIWTMFGQADDWFTSQSYPGEFGDQCRDFWLQEHECLGVGEYVNLAYGEDGDCVEYTMCGSPTRHCLYGPATGHQIPPYYAGASWEYFRSF
jgi:polyhydroxybutyrate depolymerase